MPVESKLQAKSNGNSAGERIRGFSLADCPEIVGEGRLANSADGDMEPGQD